MSPREREYQKGIYIYPNQIQLHQQSTVCLHNNLWKVMRVKKYILNSDWHITIPYFLSEWKSVRFSPSRIPGSGSAFHAWMDCSWSHNKYFISFSWHHLPFPSLNSKFFYDECLANSWIGFQWNAEGGEEFYIPSEFIFLHCKSSKNVIKMKKRRKICKNTEKALT